MPPDFDAYFYAKTAVVMTGGGALAHGITPDRRVTGIREVTPSYLHDWGVRGVIVDLDNTLALPDDLCPTPDGAAWLGSMREAGIPVVVVSNNSRERVEAFCRPLGVDFVHKSGKPFGRGMERAVEKLGMPREQAVLIGDQLFTDVLAASYHRIRCVLTEPVVLETGLFFRLKRALERAADRKGRK